MNKIKYAIISYHREECVTVRALTELGVNREDIIIFLQDEDDLPKYKNKFPDIKIILNEGKGVAVNRNNVLRYDGFSIGDWVALLDDDVISFTHFKLFFSGGIAKATSRKIYDKNIFRDILYSTFEEASRNGAIIWGCAATTNAMFAVTRLSSDGEYSINKLFQGGLVGHIIDKKTYYDESYNSVEDYEYQLRIYSRGGLTLRRNDIACSKKPNRNYAGGLFEFYRTNKQNDDIDKLCNQYSGYVKPKKDYSGVTQII